MGHLAGFRRRKFTRRLGGQTGMTLLELIIACTILLILSAMALPFAKYATIRRKEAELRFDLHEMRDAINRYKDLADRNLIKVQNPNETQGYPPDLDTLVKGVSLSSTAAQLSAGTQVTSGSQLTNGGDKRIRFLRKVPVDPITGNADWGLRSVQDDPDSTSWGGKDVFDVYSKSMGIAQDGTKYSDW